MREANNERGTWDCTVHREIENEEGVRGGLGD